MFFGNEQFGEREPLSLSFKRLAKKVFLDDWPMKLIALIVSVSLWMIVSGETVKGTLTVPLTLRTADNAEFVSAPVQEVEIVVTGDKGKIDRLAERKGSLGIYLDLSEFPIGDSVLELKPGNVSIDLPAGLRLTDIRPGRVAIRLEAVLERDVPVKPETAGAVAENFEIYSETVIPQRVRVRGPASFINTLDFVSTEKVDIDNKSADFVARQVAVTPSNPKARLLDPVVDVAFRIGEKRISKIYPIQVKDGPAGKRIDVEFSGPRSLVDAIKPGDLKAEVIKNDAGVETIKVDLPPELQDSVEVKLRK